MAEQWFYRNVQYVVVKKSRFVKNQETKGLLSNLGILDILFYSYKNKRNSKFLLAGDKFMPEMHLK